MKQVRKHLFYSFQFIWTQTESKQVKSQIRAFISQADKEQTQETHFFFGYSEEISNSIYLALIYSFLSQTYFQSHLNLTINTSKH
mmetsp:Transcript_14947/g.24405  ORF Transcript_14947/g.24405 Transcript_14947/m.24405 type:complete len:85 (+) Transcript_14947:1-255(+)